MPTVQGHDIHSHIAEQRTEHPGASCHGSAQQTLRAEPATAPAEAPEAAHPLFILDGQSSKSASSNHGPLRSLSSCPDICEFKPVLSD